MIFAKASGKIVYALTEWNNYCCPTVITRKWGLSRKSMNTDFLDKPFSCLWSCSTREKNSTNLYLKLVYSLLLTRLTIDYPFTAPAVKPLTIYFCAKM